MSRGKAPAISPDDPIVARIRAMCAAGKSLRQVCMHTGLKYQHVYSLCARSGIDFTREVRPGQKKAPAKPAAPLAKPDSYYEYTGLKRSLRWKVGGRGVDL